MKVVFAGAGAVGCHYGSRLQQAGNEVLFLARGKHLIALQQHGLLHESEGEVQRLNVQAKGDPAVVCDVDVVIFSCKMTSLKKMIQSMKDKVSPDSLLITMQNGVEAPEWVASAFPENAIAAATAFIGARLEGPGHVIHSAAGGVRLGLWQAGAGSKYLPVLVKQFKAGGVSARIDGDPEAMLWRKLLWNTGFNAITAITRRFASQICEFEETLLIVSTAMQETITVAQAEGIAIGEADIVAHIDVTRGMGPVKTSMWQDVEAGHRSEVDYLNGLVVSRGEKHGITTPVNRMLVSLMHAIEVQP